MDKVGTKRVSVLQNIPSLGVQEPKAIELSL